MDQTHSSKLYRSSANYLFIYLFILIISFVYLVAALYFAFLDIWWGQI